MKPHIVPFEPDHLYYLMSQQNVPHAIGDFPLRQQAENYAKDYSMTLCFDGEPVACWGIQKCWTGLGMAWSVIGMKARAQPRTLVRYAKQSVEMVMRHAPLRRLDTYVCAAWPQAVRFIELLGFTRQYTAERWGPNGETYYLYTKFEGEHECRP